MEDRKPKFTFECNNGLVINVFSVQPDDAGYLVDLFEHLSTNSRYMRFNQYLATVDPAIVQREAEHIAMIDPAKGMSLLAFADFPGQPHTPVAGARYIRTDDPQQAEVSLSVRDDLQHQGIGGQMLLQLAAEARTGGVRTLVGTFQTGNRRIWALLADAPYPSTTVIDGFQTTVTLDLYGTRSAPEQDSSTLSEIQQAR